MEIQYVNVFSVFRLILIALEKPVYAPVYSLFEILSNENSFKRFVANCYLIVRRVTKEGDFTVQLIHVVLVIRRVYVT